MSKKCAALVLIGLAALVLLAAGCASAPGPAATPTPTPTNQQPVDVVSVSGPLPPINPGGPIVEITLKNVASEPVVALAATIELGRTFNFTFAVDPANPLLTGTSVASRQTLIGAGFSSDSAYPLTIKGTLKSGATFAYTRQVQIAAPASK